MRDQNMDLAGQIDEKSCWYLPVAEEQMIAGANGQMWPKLESSAHWPALLRLLEDAASEGATTLLDLGCGAGCLGATEFVKESGLSYTGVDLPHIIQNVARKVNPDLAYLEADILRTWDWRNLADYDLVVTNAFLDVMERPLDTLYTICLNAPRFVIIHRQWFTEEPTRVGTHDSYGGYTYRSFINAPEFRDVLVATGMVDRRWQGTGLGDGNHSVLLEKLS